MERTTTIITQGTAADDPVINIVQAVDEIFARAGIGDAVWGLIFISGHGGPP